MTNEQYQQAFIRGFQKRAAALTLPPGSTPNAAFAGGIGSGLQQRIDPYLQQLLGIARDPRTLSTGIGAAAGAGAGYLSGGKDEEGKSTRGRNAGIGALLGGGAGFAAPGVKEQFMALLGGERGARQAGTESPSLMKAKNMLPGQGVPSKREYIEAMLAAGNQPGEGFMGDPASLGSLGGNSDDISLYKDLLGSNMTGQ